MVKWVLLAVCTGLLILAMLYPSYAEWKYWKNVEKNKENPDED